MSENTKQKLWKIVDEKSDELIKLVSDLIKINSENPTGSQEEVTQFIENYLTKGNIKNERLIPDNPSYPNILAEFGNDGGKKVLFNGHADVVPVGDLSKWNFDPFSGEITDTQILGRGTSDMKAGLAGIMFATKLISDLNAKMNGKIVIHIVTDEETGGDGTKWFIENGYADNADACIIAEPTSYNNCEVGQKGSLGFKIKAYGKSAHGSIGNYVGDNAIKKISKILSRVEELRTIEGVYEESQSEVLANSKMIAKVSLKAEGIENVIDHVTVNMGTIKGGTKVNMVADYCEVELDIRTPIGVEGTVVEKEIARIIEEEKLTDIEYDYDRDAKANYTDANSDLVKSVVKNATEIWQKEVVPAYQWASSDARYYRYKGIPTIQYGPANTEGIHSYNENVDIEDVINSTKVYLAVLTDLLDIEL